MRFNVHVFFEHVLQMSASSKPKRSSALWEFFEDPEETHEVRKDGSKIKKIKCQVCDFQLVDGRGTSNLSSHL